MTDDGRWNQPLQPEVPGAIPPGGSPAGVTPPAPNYAPAPSYAPAAVPPVKPGGTLGIVALVVCFFAAPVGMILGFVAAGQSKRAGLPNAPAKWAIILGIVFTVLWFLVVIGMVMLVWVPLMQTCAELGPGVHTYGGVTYTCG